MLACGRRGPASGSRYSSAQQSSGPNSHLWGSTMNESARLDPTESMSNRRREQRRPARRRRRRGASSRRAAQTSATPARSSITPALVEPADATTAHTPGRWSASAAAARAEPVRTPSAPVGTTSARSPSRASALATDEWTVSATATQPGRRHRHRRARRSPGHGQRAQVAGRAAAHEAAARLRWEPGQAGQEAPAPRSRRGPRPPPPASSRPRTSRRSRRRRTAPPPPSARPG